MSAEPLDPKKSCGAKANFDGHKRESRGYHDTIEKEVCPLTKPKGIVIGALGVTTLTAPMPEEEGLESGMMIYIPFIGCAGGRVV